MPQPLDTSRDRHLLLISAWSSTGFAVVSTIWGVVSGSSMITFDGLYSFVSVGLSVLGVAALRTARRGADAAYPWGREAWEPLAVVVKAAALAGLCLYAVAGGVRDLLAGGRVVATGWALAYAVVATAAGLAVTLALRRGTAAGSGLVRAEAAEWLGDTLLSVGVLVGFASAAVLVALGRPDAAAYVDPAMVVLVSVLFLRVPARLIVGAWRELLSMSAPADVLVELRSCVADVERRWDIRESFLRASQVGGRVDVEVDFVVDVDGPVRTVADCDAVRQDLDDRLAEHGHDRSVVVAVTHDRRWAL